MSVVVAVVIFSLHLLNIVREGHGIVFELCMFICW